MNNQLAQPLALVDVESVSKVILELIAQYPDLPFAPNNTSLQWQNLSLNEGIGVFTLQGAVYLKKYLSGSFVGQIPFRILYKCTPTSNYGRLEAQSFVEELAKWLETCTATLSDESIEFQSIERTSLVTKDMAQDSGAEIYTCTMNAKYTQNKQGGF